MNRFALRTVLVAGAHLSALVAIASGQESESSDSETAVSRYDRAIYMSVQGAAPDEGYSVSACVISHGESLFIVVPRFKWPSWSARIGIPSTTVDSRWVDVRDVSDWSEGNPWLHHDDVLLSILPLTESTENQADIEHLRKVAIPVESMARTVPARGTRLDIIGFPLHTDKAHQEVPPTFVWNSTVASEELRVPRLPQRSFLASPPGSIHFLGSPVFLHAEGETSVRCVGVVVRYLPRDSDGSEDANWILMVSARSIDELIRSHE